MEKKPNKKEELTLVNNVLKLATKLLKVRIKMVYPYYKKNRIAWLRNHLCRQEGVLRLKFILYLCHRDADCSYTAVCLLLSLWIANYHYIQEVLFFSCILAV